MSTRSKKTSSTTRTSRETTRESAADAGTSSVSSATMSTPTSQTASRSPRERPPSPTVISRRQEKDELAHLNDRFATYIDRVRYLEGENSRLTRMVQSQEEVVTREVTNIKSLYETELADARRLLDDTAKDKAKLQIDVDKYKSELVEFKEKYQRREREYSGLEKRLLGAEAQVNDLQARLTDAVQQRKHWENEYNRLKREFEALEKQLATAKKQLEEETIARVDLENRIQSLKEELAFKQQVHEQELNETRVRTETTMEEVDGRLHEEYEGKLSDALKQMREDTDEQIRSTRQDTEAIFNQKLEDLHKLSERHDAAREQASRQLRNVRRTNDELSSQLSKLTAENSHLLTRLAELEDQLKREQDDHEASVQARDSEIRRLRTQLEDQLREYRDLLDIKIQLDMEIAAYRKLLESEESRLNLSSASEATPGRRTPVRGGTPVGSRKRKRTLLESSSAGGRGGISFQSSAQTGFSAKTSAKGDVIVQEADENGKFIKLTNTSEDKDIPLGGWQLRHETDKDEVSYKFHRTLVIKAGQSVTVWSSDADTAHNPPSDLVMKNRKWAVADNMLTVLANDQGEDMATCEMTRSKFRTSITQRSTLMGHDETDDSYSEENSGWFGRLFSKK